MDSTNYDLMWDQIVSEMRAFQSIQNNPEFFSVLKQETLNFVVNLVKISHPELTVTFGKPSVAQP
jgi:hypothetical protein